jgi:hypothetical protein
MLALFISIVPSRKIDAVSPRIQPNIASYSSNIDAPEHQSKAHRNVSARRTINKFPAVQYRGKSLLHLRFQSARFLSSLIRVESMLMMPFKKCQVRTSTIYSSKSFALFKLL